MYTIEKALPICLTDKNMNHNMSTTSASIATNFILFCDCGILQVEYSVVCIIVETYKAPQKQFLKPGKSS